jgi:hypothetical protein
VAIVLTQEVNGQAVGATYNGDAALVPWLIAEGYALDTSNVRDHTDDTAVTPAQDPLLASNREEPNGTQGWAAANGVQGDSRTFQFGADGTVQKPQVYQITPNKGVAAGGTALVIKGDNFTGVTAVTIGAVATTAFSVVNDKEIHCTTGAHAAGPVNVVLDKTGTANDVTVTNGFTYTA